ncbi:MAG: tRNA (guanosine(46)-N7)-methyltransferase TrmB, partial [Bacteroidota bacterium]
MDMYRYLLRPNSWVHLKTDNLELYQYTLETLQQRKDLHSLKYTDNLYQSALYEKPQQIVTTYEKKFVSRGVPIKYLRFQFN